MLMIFLKKHNVITVLTIILFTASCVPNRRITMLQHTAGKGDELKANELKARKYETGIIEYLLNPNDLLDIKISTMTPSAFNPFNDADRTLVPGMVYGQSGSLVQSHGYYIDPDGFLELPILGRLPVAGLTISQAQDSIASVVKKYLERPVVRLRLLNFRFSVIGEVENESTQLSGDNNLSLLQALSMAGGASEFGDLSKIKIIRRTGETTYVFYVNLLTEDYLSSPFYYVQPNDVIVVPPLKQRPYLKYVSPNLSIFATAVSLLVAVFTLFRIK